jgi:hypothetical protein
MTEVEHPANTISDPDWQVFSNQRARALEKMPREQFDKHLNTHKTAEAGKRGRN